MNIPFDTTAHSALLVVCAQRGRGPNCIEFPLEVSGCNYIPPRSMEHARARLGTEFT